jgi:cell division protein FtsB
MALRPRLSRIRTTRRLVAVGAALLLAFFYYRPLQSYFGTRHELEQRSAEVRALEAQHHALEHRLATSGTTPALIREARRLGLIRPGERLFIVKGIAAWDRARTSGRAGRP